MRALRRHRELLRHTDDNPLLGQLLAAMSQRVCERETVERTAAARAGLRGAGIAEVRYAPNIVACAAAGSSNFTSGRKATTTQPPTTPRRTAFSALSAAVDLSGDRGWTRAQRGQWRKCSMPAQRAPYSYARNV